MLVAALGGDGARELAGDGTATPSARYFAAMSLADTGTPADYPLLDALLDAPDTDLRVGAATAVLQIARRHPTTRPAGDR
jgi:hypothetical protein